MKANYLYWKNVALVVALVALTCSASAADTNALLNAWLDAQAKVQTWQADVTQTRTLKSFTRPLTAKGRVWFQAPDKFHWELGQPPQTIAVRGTDQMLVIYPRLKRVEKYPLNATLSAQWKDMMDLLQTGFPKNRTELESRFNITAVNVNGDLCEVVLEPKSSSARKMLPHFKLMFSTNDQSMQATEMQFADGSTMRNDFHNTKTNIPLDESLFAPKIPSDYKVVEPMKQR